MDISKYNGKHNPLYATRSKFKKDKAAVLEAKKAFYNTVRWGKLRDQCLRDTPLCVRCAVRGYITEADTVDHVLVFTGKSDPLATDTDNLRSLCHMCHSMVTAEEVHRRGEWLKRHDKGESIGDIAKEKYRANVLDCGLDGY